MGTRVFAARALAAVGIAAVVGACPKEGVVTQRVDNARRGAFLFESDLTPSAVGPQTFKRLYERNVDGPTLANPLVVPDVSLPTGTTRTLFFMATAKNCLYAFDLNDTDKDGNPPESSTQCMPPIGSGVDLSFRDPAGHCNVSTKAIWTRELAAAGCADSCNETWPNRVGVTATPTIDRAKGWMLLVSYHVDTREHFLHKIDITTGADVQPPVQIAGNVGTTVFKAACHRSRPGLLLQNGVVYIGFASFGCDMDCGPADPFHGWVFGYNEADLSPAGVYTTSADGGGAGIWQAGNGLAGDGTAIFAMTGNEHPPTARGDSFLRLRSNGGAIVEDAFWQPTNHERLRIGDTDLSASGPVVLPDGRILGGGKEGRLYVLDGSLKPPVQEWIAFTNTYHDDATKPPCSDFTDWRNDPTDLPCYIPTDHYQDSEHWGPNIHSGPVYWESDADPGAGFVFVMPEKDYLKQFRYDRVSHQMDTTPRRTAKERAHDGMPGGAISLSASGRKDGIVWANIPDGNGQFYGPVNSHFVAFEANELRELFRDDDPVAFAKFNPPVAAAGHVIRPTFANIVIVYGLATPNPCGAGPVNACGGCTTLPNFPGGGCQDAATKKCGHWRCIGTNTTSGITCDTTYGVQNACGGCGLMGVPGSGYGRGDKCICPSGGAQDSTLVCSADKNHLICCPCVGAGGLLPGCR
jgi:hypothetical protein